MLLAGATRGNGHTGEDVTPNVLQMADIPEYLSVFVPGTLIVHGEAYMKRSVFAALNKQKEDGRSRPVRIS